MQGNLSCVRIISREVVRPRKTPMRLKETDKAYVAGFLDGDGSIYVRIKPNKSYRFKFQIAPSVVFFQSKENKKFLQSIQCLLGIGNIRERKDGICEILDQKQSVKTGHDFVQLTALIDRFEKLNYSKKRKISAQVVQDTLEAEDLLTP